MGPNLNFKVLTEFVEQATEGAEFGPRDFVKVPLRVDRSLAGRRWYLLVSCEVLAELEKHRKPSVLSESAPFPGLAAGLGGVEIRLHRPTAIMTDPPCLWGEPWACCVSTEFHGEIMQRAHG